MEGVDDWLNSLTVVDAKSQRLVFFIQKVEITPAISQDSHRSPSLFPLESVLGVWPSLLTHPRNGNLDDC